MRPTGSRIRRALQLLCVAPALILLVLGPGCAQRTHVSTVPEGVSVTFEGQLYGETPDVILPTRSGWMRDYSIQLSRPGYEPQSIVLSSSYRADLSLFLLALGILPYFFSARLEDNYSFSLAKVRPGARPAAKEVIEERSGERVVEEGTKVR